MVLTDLILCPNCDELNLRPGGNERVVDPLAC